MMTIKINKFQFTRPQGARQKDEMKGIKLEQFQFTRPQGARQLPLGRHPPPFGFNSRARKGRD